MDQKKQQEAKKIYGKDYIGNVIRILDKRTIIINAGKDTLSVGDQVQIYEACEMLKDVDGCELGVFYFIKDRLEVVQTEKLYSVCKKMDTVTKSTNLTLSPLLEFNKTEYLPLKIDESDIQALKPKDPLVRVGDPVKLA